MQVNSGLVKIHLILWILSVFEVYGDEIYSFNISSQEVFEDEYVQKKIDDFKVRLHLKLEEKRFLRRRSTREKNGDSSFEVQSFISEKLDWKLNSSQSISTWCPVYANNSNLFVSSGNVVYLFENLEFKPLYEFPSSESLYALQGFHYENRIWLVGLQKSIQSKHFIQMYEYDFFSLTKRQQLSLPGTSAISTLAVKHKVYLSTISHTSDKSIFKLFEWSHTQFDRIKSQTFKGRYGAIVMFSIHTAIYIAASFKDYDRTLIMAYDEYKQELTKIQYLEEMAQVIKYLKNDDEFYLLCGVENVVIVYWWSGSSFLKQQRISSRPLKHVIDISGMNLFQESIIAVAWNDQVEYYIQNASTYVSSGYTNFTPDSLKSITFWKKDESFYLLPISDEITTTVYQLRLNFTVSYVEEKIENLNDCTENFDKVLKERNAQIEEMNSRVTKIWSPKKLSSVPNITVNGFVTVHQNVTSYKINILSNVSMELPSFLKDYIFAQQNEIFELQTILDQTVLQNESEEVKTNVHFINPVKVNEVSIGKLEHFDLNGVQTSLLPTTLKVTGLQTFSSYAMLAAINASTIKTDLLNGREMGDFIHLKNSNNVSGSFVFKDISVKDMEVSNYSTVNELILQNIVLSSHRQDITDKKYFANLTSDVIECKSVNGENIAELALVYLDTGNITKLLNFTSELTVLSNIEALSLRDVNISHLFRASAKKYGSEVIKGVKNFYGPVEITEYLKVSGLTNQYNLSHLMSVNTHQTIYGPIRFTNVTFKELEVDFLNGFEFSKETVKKQDKKNVIRKRVIFSERVKVENITMEDDTLIDSVDPSHDLFLTFVSNSTIEMENVTVLDEIKTEDSQFLLLNYLKNVWMKTKPQNVSTIHLKEFIIKNVTVSALNGLSIDDFVLTNELSYVFSTKIFLDDTQIGILSLSSGKMIDFSMHFFEFNVQFLILHAVHMENMLIIGNLSVKDLNNISTSQLMLTQANQTCFIEKTFSVIRVSDLSLENLIIQNFKNVTFIEYLANSIRISPTSQILNKKFENLSGNMMLTDGTINGRNVSKFFTTAVTTDTSQNIPGEIKFIGAVLMKNVNVSTFFCNITLDSVVFVDQQQNISSNRTFTGVLYATTVKASGEFNGINLSYLQSNAFNKTLNNFISKSHKFQSSMHANEIQVIESAMLDDIDLGNVVRLERKMSFKTMSSKAIKTMNIIIHGLINGCNFTSILANAVPSEHGGLTIMQKKNSFISLKVNGDLKIEKQWGEKFADLTDFLISQDKFSGQFHLANITVKMLQFKDLVNESADINFILLDAVKKKDFQVIKARKTFRDLTVNKISVNRLNTMAACGVNIKQLYKGSVKKKSHKNKNVTVEFKTMLGISAKNVTIFGCLNKVNISEDLILTNSSETLHGVIINNTMNASSGLTVFGHVDTVDLKRLVNSRVTLNGIEKISSVLRFLQDILVKDGSSIKGLVNRINLAEVVSKIKKYEINGIKTFKGNLNLGSNLSAPLVNKIPRATLSAIVKVSKNSKLSNFVQFHAMNASDLRTDTINNISMTNLWDYMHKLHDNVDTQLFYFSTNISIMSHYLSIQQLASEHLLSSYAYFELHQVLTLDKAQMFLPVYERGKHGDDFEFHATHMVIWVNKNESCAKTESYIMDILADGSLNKTKRLQGKIFPFFIRRQSDLRGFYLHTDLNNRCAKVTESFIRPLYSNEDMFNASVSQSDESVINESSNASILDAKLFETRRDVYMILLFSFTDSQEKIYVYHYNFDNTWSLHQKFHNLSAGAFDLTMENNIHLAVTGDYSQPGVHIYKWMHKEKNFEFLNETSVYTSVSSAALWIKKDENLFLLLAKEKTKIKKDSGWIEVYTEPVEVYILEEKLVLDQIINIKGIHSLETFDIAGETYILASSRHTQVIYIIQHRGFNGFEVTQEISAPGVIGTKIFVTQKNDIMLAVSSSTGHTRILKTIIRGGGH